MKQETVLMKKEEKKQQKQMRAAINPKSYYVYGLCGHRKECSNMAAAERVAYSFLTWFKVAIKIMRLSKDEEKYMETVKVVDC